MKGNKFREKGDNRLDAQADMLDVLEDILEAIKKLKVK